MIRQKHRLSKISFTALEGKKSLNIKKLVKYKRTNKKESIISDKLAIPNLNLPKLDYMEDYQQMIGILEWLEKNLPIYIDLIIFKLEINQIKFEEWNIYIGIINQLIKLKLINQEKLILLAQALKKVVVKISSDIEYNQYLFNISNLDTLINFLSTNNNQLTR